MQTENKTLQLRANKLDSEILKKLQTSKNVQVKFLHPKMFEPRSKSYSQIKSNLFKPKKVVAEEILREQVRECTFKPIINKVDIPDYIPIVDRVFPKKEVVLNENMNQTELNELIKTKNKTYRVCLPEGEWEQKERVVLSEKNIEKKPEQEIKAISKPLNPKFYEDQCEWLRQVHKKIRIAQLSHDQEDLKSDKLADQNRHAKTKKNLELLLQLEEDFFKRMNENDKKKEENINEILKTTYNFKFQPSTNKNYDTVKSKVFTELPKTANPALRNETGKSPIKKQKLETVDAKTETKK